MRALLSVYDKTGLVEFARGLSDLGVEILSSGGTSKALAEAGVAHREVAEVTGAPEMLGGRVKTLRPRIHGGILADRSKPDHLADLEAQQIELIDLVCCNLYPFSSDRSIEMIDVGGPTMVRAAAKNHEHVAVLVDPGDYGPVLAELASAGTVSGSTRRRLARAAFAHTAAYDAAIVEWLDEGDGGELFPPTLHLTLERRDELRYGENPHQRGARYVSGAHSLWDGVVQHGGRELSYLNVLDAEAAWRLAHDLQTGIGVASAAVVVKHANPCGVAVGDDLVEAYLRAIASDPMSAFGGIVALPGRIDAAFAETIISQPLADVLIAESITPEAAEIFAARRRNMRPLEAPAPGRAQRAYRQIDGGYLVQDPDRFAAPRDSWRTVTKRQPDLSQWTDIELAWRVCAATMSNAIVVANGGAVVGVGCGQQNRVDAARLAVRKAEGRAEGGVGASDAFFPFRDGLDAIVDGGVTVVIQPGGSLRDDDVVAAADERGIAMLLTGERHFRH